MITAAVSRRQRTSSATLSALTFDPVLDFACQESVSPDEHFRGETDVSLQKSVYSSVITVFKIFSKYNTIVLL